MNRADESQEHAAERPMPESATPAPRRVPPGRPLAVSAAPAFHSDDVDDVANYQSLSVLALVSLLFGLASPLSILSNGFLLLPLCGLAISLLAVRRIATSEGRLAGRWPAVIGLALCVTCGTTAIARNSMTRYLRTAQAEEFALAWLKQIAANEMDVPFKSTYEGARPLAPPEPGAPTPEKTPYETFLGDPVIQKINAAGKDAKIEHDKTLEFTPLARREFTVRQRFLIVPPSDLAKSASTDPIEVDLTLHRSHFRGESDTRWLVTRYEPANDPDN